MFAIVLFHPVIAQNVSQKTMLNKYFLGCRHSSVDLSAPTILPPRVQIPSTPSMLLSFIVFVLYLSCEKNENKQKEAEFGTFLKITKKWIR